MIIDGMRAVGRQGAKGRKAGLRRIKVRDEDDCDRVPTGKVGHGKDLRDRGLNWYDRTESCVSVAPLKRMLQENLGCRWSTLRAKLVEGTRPVDRRMLEVNLNWLVASGADVTMVKGEPYRKAQSHHGPFKIFERFYEHPVTGLLCTHEREKWDWSWKTPEVDPEAPFEIDGVSYVVKKGLWYRRIIQQTTEPTFVWDRRTTPATLVRSGSRVVETVMLRQISGKERDRLLKKRAA